MKKLLALLLALLLVFALAACGSTDDTSDAETEDTSVTDTTDVEATDGEATEAVITDEQLAALTEAYSEASTIYNDLAVAANENGWMADEQTAAEIDSVSSVLTVVGTALTEDLSILNDADLDALPEEINNMIPTLEELAEKVAVPYEG